MGAPKDLFCRIMAHFNEYLSKNLNIPLVEMEHLIYSPSEEAGRYFFMLGKLEGLT